MDKIDKKSSHGGKTSTSISTPSFRFNAHDEELEELFPDEQESPSEDQIIVSSEPFVRDSSPFSRFGKRSTSVDSNNIGTETSTTDHPWSFFNEIKGKIGDKIDEIKKERNQKNIEKKLSLSKQNNPTATDDVPEELVQKNENQGDNDNIETDKDMKKDQQTPNHLETKKESSEQNKIKQRISDFKQKFNNKPTPATVQFSNTQSSPTIEILRSESNSDLNNQGSELDDDVIEMAQEADADVIESFIEPKKPSTQAKYLFSNQRRSIAHTTCRTPGLVETFCKNCLQNFKILILTLSLFGFYFEMYPLLVSFSLGALFAMEINSIMDWLKELIYVWTDSNSEYLITTNPYLMPSVVPVLDAKSMKPIQAHKIEYVGWVNEFKLDYNITRYHLSLTNTVYIQLQGSMLRISEPKIKIPKKQVWNDPQLKLLFNVARLYNISNCQVLLLPKGLSRQRIWNKKYPICIVLNKDSQLGIKFRNKGQSNINEEEAWLPFDVAENRPLESNETPVQSTQQKKSKSTDNFIALHENFKLNLEKNLNKQLEEERNKKAKDDGPELKPTVPVRRKKSSLKTFQEELGNVCNDGDGDRNDFDKKIVINTEAALNKDAPSDDTDEEEDSSIATDFQVIESPEVKENCLYLFATTDRDKEVWYRRLKAATTFYSIHNENEDKPQHFLIESEEQTKFQEQYDAYVKMMTNLHQAKIPTLPSVSKQTVMPNTVTDLKDEGTVSEQIMWINAMIGRSLFDVFRNVNIKTELQCKLQRKLDAIRIPRYLGKLNISKLEFSNNAPLITNASPPRLDHDGIWFELDIVYEGTFRIQIDTNLILMNLKKLYKDSACDSNPASPSKESRDQTSKLPTGDLFNDFADGIDFDHEEKRLLVDQTNGAELLADGSSGASSGSSNRMFLKMFDKITDNAYVKKLMENVANKHISLYVELQGLAGRLVVNIPPPPSDRLWYGFKGSPRLWLTAYPKVGDKELSLISSILQKIICAEFQDVIVLPNMDDFVLEGLVEDPLS